MSDKKYASIEDDDEDYEDYENSGKSEMGEDGEMVGGIYAKEKPVSSSSLFQVIPCLEWAYFLILVASGGLYLSIYITVYSPINHFCMLDTTLEVLNKWDQLHDMSYISFYCPCR